LAAFTGFERIRVDNARLGSGRPLLSTARRQVDALVCDDSNKLSIELNGSNIINGDPIQTGIGTDLIFTIRGAIRDLSTAASHHDLTANTFSREEYKRW
jgi:hypothetical protein